MSKETLKLKKEWFEFKSNMISRMESIGIDHCFEYMLEQYFEDFEKILCMDKWETPEWYNKNSDLNVGIVFKGMKKEE